jgi:hypothetical protein
MEKFLEVLQANDGDMPFDAFVAAVRAEGGRPELWLRAKHQGVVETYIADGVHRIRLPEQPA